MWVSHIVIGSYERYGIVSAKLTCPKNSLLDLHKTSRGAWPYTKACWCTRCGTRGKTNNILVFSRSGSDQARCRSPQGRRWRRHGESQLEERQQCCWCISKIALYFSGFQGSLLVLLGTFFDFKSCHTGRLKVTLVDLSTFMCPFMVLLWYFYVFLLVTCMHLKAAKSTKSRSLYCWDGHLHGKSWTGQPHAQGLGRTSPDITKGALNAPGQLWTIYGHREHI